MTEFSPPTFSVAQALQQAASQGLARVDAQMLLLHLMQQPAHARAWLITHDGDMLNAEQQARWASCAPCASKARLSPI
jgi:release factor glutamine methyltransferase